MDIRNFNRPEKAGTGIPGMATINPDSGPQGDINTGEVTTDLATEPTEVKNDSIQEYLRYLEEHDIHKEDILGVLDSIISTGNVYWSFNLFEKIPVTFKIRPSWVNDILVDRMDKLPPKTFSKFSETVGCHNLAGSLVTYKDTSFNVDSKEVFEKSLEFVKNLPFIIQNHLIKKMAIFDRVVAVATSDWAVENFTPPQSEK